ncbi:MAG: hypothetical protein AAF292_13275 [Pseudomonadota bacterium]
MSPRSASIFLGLVLAVCQLALPALANDHDHDPVHEGHDCAICVVALAEEDDTDGLEPTEYCHIPTFETVWAHSAIAASDEDVGSFGFQPRGPPRPIQQ